MPREISNARCLRLSRTRPEPYFVEGKTVYFGSGREAVLSFARTIGKGRDNTVLLPAYVPEGLYKPFEFLDWRISLYPVDTNLEPEWEALETLFATERPCLAVMIHYFGLEMDITRFGKICRTWGTLLIEDMAHVLPGAGCRIGVTGDVDRKSVV